MELENQAAIVTGAAAGVGRGIAMVLARRGAAVLVADIDGAAAEATAAAIRAEGGRAAACAMDVRAPEQAEAALDALAQRFGPVTIAVNNAGSTARRPFLEMELGFFEDLIRLNLTGVFITAQAAARRMVAAGTAGRIVNIASNSGIFGGVGRAAYSPSKAGIIALTQSMAVELGPHGIRVNAVAPGPVKTERQPLDVPDVAFTQRMSLARFGTPEEVGETVAFLASDRASFTTGHCYGVDGGLTVSGIMTG
jgi:3-oxoacyl-[acyl-carrier protein] reductase